MEHKHVANTLEVIGFIVIIAAVIAGFALGNVHKVTTDEFGYPTTSDDFSWSTALGVWFGGLVSGFTLIGLARLIELLMEIQGSMREMLSEMTKQRWSLVSLNKKDPAD